ncbi:unnamed protein product [Rotaria sordida]|uniref:Uncharacterized protein n=1 Tax=Rotaria sordida TaxID=392033 RepID=A0A816AR29_9BILA|nr:unnamed protein product [Rotaria sordida]CAF1599657.1 unnamed protein product [Rotaria sordida]
MTLNDDNDKWEVVVNKNKQKQIIHQLLTIPTKLNDETIETIPYDVCNAHLEFNQAIVEHSQYIQLEDYYILKHAIIIAMITTCVSKYFDVIQKLVIMDVQGAPQQHPPPPQQQHPVPPHQLQRRRHHGEGDRR